jgi:hypothetical protein
MSTFATANGVPLVAARLFLPRTGVWHAELAADFETPLEGRVELDLGGVAFSGTALRAGSEEGVATLRVVGGAGGLGRSIGPQGYTDVPFSVPLHDILAVAEERQASSCAPDVLQSSLRHWTRAEGTCARALLTLVFMGAAGASWRVLPGGELWVGRETWEEASVEHETIASTPLSDSAIFYMERPSLVPGKTFLGRRVSFVEHSLTEEGLRTTASFEPA